MVKIVVEGTKVKILVHLPELNDEDKQFPFTFQCSDEWIARALYKILREEFWGRMEDIRRAEYEQGLRDARKRKAERSDWFMRNFNVRDE